ncbi:MAG: YbjQ family protein [Synechococcales cyanobacterium RM1_1_8]|nr:YbjQ family protein [Synechococcales cyanobacterium RM1_1_8]
MLTTTTDLIQGYEIQEYLGLTTAEVVYGTNALRDFMAGLRDVFGGRTASYEKVFEKGQQEALQELEDRAARKGANAVIGIRINTDSINIDNEGVLFLITATGTAVRLK